MNEILKFLKKPSLGEVESLKPRFVVTNFVYLILISFAFSTILMICNSLGFNLPGEIYKDQASLSSTYHKSTVYFLIIILIPILEEFAFRGWFTKNKFLIAFSITILSFYFWKLIGVYKSFREDYLALSLQVIGSGALLWIYSEKLRQFVSAHSKVLVFLSAVAFAFIHIFNFNLHNYQCNLAVAFSIILILVPYFLKGIILTFTRFQSGLIGSIIIHILNNSMILIPMILGKRTG